MTYRSAVGLRPGPSVEGAIMVDLMWLSFALGLTLLGLIYVRLLGSGDTEQQP